MTRLAVFLILLATGFVSALLCDQREYYDFPTNSCLPCMEHCNYCDAGHTCFQCDAYWYLDEWDLQCYECIPDCKLCFGPYGWDCFECEDPNDWVVGDACLPCDTCEEGVTYAYQQCNAFWNRVCYNCDTCPSGKYESVPCNVDENVVCEDCSTTCPSGTYAHAACTPLHDLDCQSCSTGCTTCTGPNGNQCSVCQTGYYLVAGVGCSACSTCGTGFYQSAACTATTNTVCTACSGTCPGGEYQSSACGGTADRVCSTCATCGSGEWQVSACNSLANTVCQACHVCGSGFYETTACGATSDTICTACLADCHSCTGTDFASCSACKPGFFLDAPNSVCTACVDNCATCADTTFGTCTLCKDGYFLDAGSSTCKACTPCASGKYETSPCDGVDDRVCSGDCLANCKTCTGPDFADCSQCVRGYGLKSATSTCAACATAPCPNSLHMPWDRCYDSFVSTCQHCVVAAVGFCGTGGNPPQQWIVDEVGNVVRAGCCSSTSGISNLCDRVALMINCTGLDLFGGN